MNETEEREVVMQSKLDMIGVALRKISSKLETFELQHDYPSKAHQILTEEMLETLHTTYKEVSKELSGFLEEESESDEPVAKKFCFRLSPSKKCYTKYPTEYKKMIPYVNKFLREEAVHQSEYVLPLLSDIEHLVRHVLSGKKDIARELAKQIMRDIKPVSRKTQMDLRNWVEGNGENDFIVHDHSQSSPLSRTDGDIHKELTSEQDQMATHLSEHGATLKNANIQATISITEEPTTTTSTPMADKTLGETEGNSDSGNRALPAPMDTIHLAISASEDVGRNTPQIQLLTIDEDSSSSPSCYNCDSTDYEDFDDE